MANINKQDEKLAAPLLLDLDTIKEYLDRIFINRNVSRTAAAIYEEIFEELQVQMTAETFVNAFRACVRSGKVNGLKNAGRLGYVRDFDSSIKIDAEPKREVEGESAPEKMLTIEVSERLRLVQSDSLNWALQQYNGNLWIGIAYWPRLTLALEKVADKLLREELKSSTASVKDFLKMKEVLDAAEQRIAAQLSNMVKSASSVSAD